MSDLQVLQNKAARLILDLPVHSSASEALKRLGWKPLVRRRMLSSYISYLITIFATRVQSFLMAIFTVLRPGL